MRKINPFKEMTAIAQNVADGNLSEGRAESSSKDEVGILAQSINTMGDNLRGLIEEFGQALEQVAASTEELKASSELRELRELLRSSHPDQKSFKQ